MINGKKILRKSSVVLLWIIGAIIFLFSVVWIILKVPKVQNFLVSKVISFIQDKTHTRVELNYIDIGFPKSLLLQGIFLEDKQHDTLLYLKELEVDINMLALLKHTISVQRLTLKDANVRLIRNEGDSSFNFQFLIDAFTTPDKETIVTDPKSSNPWKIKADHVSLKNIRFRMNDASGGLNVLVNASRLNASLKKLDLPESAIELGDFELSDAHTSIITTKHFPSDSSSSTTGWNNILVSGIYLENSFFTYHDIVSSLRTQITVGELKLDETAVNLSKQTIRSEGLSLSNTSSLLQLQQEEVAQYSAPSDTTTLHESDGWRINISSVEMKKNSFRMDISNRIQRTSGVDWNHLYLTGISTSIKDIIYDGPEIKATIKSLSLQERSGFGIRSLRANASLTNTTASLKDFDLITNSSRIGQEANLTFSSLKEIPSSLLVQCSLYNNRFALRELLLLMPQLDTVEIIHKNKDRVIDFSLEVKGSMQQLNVQQFVVHTLNTTVNAQGSLKFITQPDKLWMDVEVKKIETRASDLFTILPDSLIPRKIHLPDSMSVEGHFIGSVSDFKTEVLLNSSIGEATLQADIKNLLKDTPVYAMAISTQQLNLGKLLGQSNVGKITATLEANGTGFDTSTAVGSIKADVASVEINRYSYNAIAFEASIDKTYVTAQASMDDSNLVLTLDTKMNISKGRELYDLTLDLKAADLYALGYTSDRINFTATTVVHLIGDPRKNIDGNITTKNILVIKNGKRYRSDSLVFVSVNEDGRNSMKLNSSMVAANFEGNINILSIVPAITNHLNRYFQYTEVPFKKTNPQNFTFEFQLNDSPLLREVILPSLKEYNPLHIKGSFNSEETKLEISAEIPFATYDNITVSGLTLDLNTGIDKLNYTVHWNYLKTSGITIEYSSLDGVVAHDTASINVLIKNNAMIEKLMLRTYVTKSVSDHYRFSILKNGLRLQEEEWIVSDKNYIEFGPKYIFADQFKAIHDHQSIYLQSTAGGEDMTLNFSSFDLHTLSQIVEDDEALVQGILDGEIKLKNFLDNPAFTSELAIKNFIFKKSRVGNLSITADNLTTERYTAKVVLTDSLNKATISGYYLSTGGKDALHFKADLDVIELSSIEAFSRGQIAASTGFIRGNISITGAVKDPKFNGEISFVKASTKVAYLNQRLSMDKQTITISPERVTFNSFKITDSLTNEAIITGYAGIESFSNINFHLNVTTKDFMVLNTTAVHNKLYYGKVILNSQISIRGNQNLPVINADVDIVHGSHFTFAIPDSKISVDRGDGIVVFTNDSSSLDPIMLRQKEEIVQKITGLDITANISINRNSTLKILVDPISGDSLSVKGDADLNFRMDASGQTSLNGRYIVNEGNYKASLENLIIRRFKIVKGSTIIWSGDPLEALIDITATYSTKTSPEGLLVNSPGVDSSALRKPLPFIVTMMMRGELLKPVINFKLDMPDNAKGAVGGEVYAKITEINSNESEINKQVFALLLLNRFIASDNSGIGGTSDFARRSVSRMMSNELNKLSSKYVNGLQIDVDVQSYNDINNGQQQGNTQLELGITKSLLDERLSVQVGTNVAIEGQNNTSGSNAKNFTGDIVVEYKLTKSGRYKARAFRTNQYDGISNGTIVQTGIGLVFTRNFTHLKELFSSGKKKKNKEQLK